MSKAKQLMELATQDIIAECANEKNIGITEAMNIFYGSEFCKKLYDESTGLYLEGTKYLYGLLENEIKNLTSNYKKLQRRRIVTSIIFRKLVNIAERSTNCNEPLLTEQLWFSIVSEITETYPNLKMYLLERYPNLSSQEWEYCCLCMFNFDSKTEARLLGINPSSVSTKRLRFRQKLGISAL